MKQLLTNWRKHREHNRKMKRFFTLLEAETVSLRDTMLALAEVYVDAAKMAEDNKQEV